MAITYNNRVGKEVRVSTLEKDKNELIELIKIGLEVKYGYENLVATNVQYNKIGFLFSIDYKEDV